MSEVRRATRTDAEAILALWKAAEATASVTDTLEDVRRMIETERAAFLLAMADGAVVGSLIATFDGWRGNMYRLATHPGQRRNGIARTLVAEAERVLDEWGAKRVTALVEMDHPWAVGFWRAAGYRLDERVSRYVRDLGSGGSRGR